MVDHGRERLPFIRDHVRELRELARSGGYGLLVYLLDMAFAEANLQMNPPNQHPDRETRRMLGDGYQ